MKFADGFWMNKKQYNVSYASQAYDIKCSNTTVNVLATPYVIYNRGMTLSGPNLEVTFSSPCPNVIKVSILHFKGTNNNSPEYKLNYDASFLPKINDNNEFTAFISKDTKAVIKKGNEWNIQYYFKDKKLTECGWKSTSYIKENEHSTENRKNSYNDNQFYDFIYNGNSYLREQLSLDIVENIYGFGEKFTPFIKNGQTVEIWNSDGGTCSDQSYKSVPFYISSKGYGIFVNTTDKVSFEVASDTVSKVSFTVADEKLEYFVIGGNSISEVLENYTFLTGRPALPPASSFGLWLSTSFTTKYDENTVLSFIDGMKDRNIPLQVFHFDCFWMKEYEWTNFEWNNEFFPEPVSLLNKIKERNISISVWINPYIAQRSSLFDVGVKNGYFIKNKDESVFQCDMWQPGMAIVDFTNPDACNWFASKIKKLCDFGVNFIKTDFGERIPVDVIYYNKMNSVKMHNYYTYLYNKTVFDVLKNYYGENNACLFARSATSGCQQFPVHWGGDCSASYSSMAETIRGGLSLCCSGFGFYSHDISGFEDTASPDIYKRWCAFGLMSSHSRLHGNSSYRVPWLFDNEAVDVLKFFTMLKGRLMPYIYAQAVKTSKTGIPMMRAMFIEYNNDPICLTLDKQYMFGDSLLIAPILNENSSAEFYLPEGKWTDIITGEVFIGGKYYKKYYSYFEMPVMAKENSLIAYGDFKENFEYDYLKNAEIVYYSPLENTISSTEIYDSKGNLILKISAQISDGNLKINHSKIKKSFNFKLNDNSINIKIDSNSPDNIIIKLHH